MKKILMTSILSILLAGCHGVGPDDGTGTGNPSNGGLSDLEGPITLYADRDIIMADDSYTATLTVLLLDDHGVEHDVTSEVEIYLEGEDKPVGSREFKTSKAGEYSFYAVRGFDISNTVTVTAAGGVPEFPTDTDAENISFRHHMMLLQHTGNECPNCPRLMEILKQLAGEEDYSSRYYHVASHSYNTSDAAYSSAAASLSKTLGVRYYPWLTFNLSTDNGYLIEEIKEGIDRLAKDVADAGISAAAARSGDNVYVNVNVKAGKEAKYRVTAWLLEDNIHSVQSGATASWQNMHENCLRAMAGTSKTENIYGKNIGSLAEGECHDLILSLDLESGWKTDNCKVMVIVTSGADEFELVNCAVFPVGGSVSYEYK